MPADSFEQIMGRLRTGDAEAAAQVFHRFAGRLIGLARTRLDARLRQNVDPEDVLQSAYKSFFLRYGDGQFDPHNWESLWALLTVITLRKCGRWRERFHAGRRDLNAEVPQAPDPEASGTTWEGLDREPTPAEAALLAETVEQLLRDLDEREREIVSLALQGYTAPEIGNQLNRPRRTVYRILERIKKHLERLRAEDGTPA
jgi:RNA polymerase sigma-70 factor (ECF subfamily)